MRWRLYLTLVAIVLLGGSPAPGPLTLASPGTTDLRPDRVSDPVILRFTAPVDLKDLRAALSSRRASGAPAPLLVTALDDRRFAVKAPAAAGRFVDLSIAPGLRGLSGADYTGPTKLRITYPREPATLRSSARRDPLFYGVNTNSSPSFRDQTPAAVRDLGVGFVRLGWSISGVNPRCLPLSQQDSWSWTALDRMLDTYRQAGTKVVLTLLQAGGTPCANGGSDDRTVLIDTPERYADYVEGVARHVLRQHPGLIVAFELGNEPDQPQFWKSANPRFALDRHKADAYFAYLKPSATALRRVVEAQSGPRPVILNGGFGGAELDWWRSLVSKPGFGDLVDDLNIHIYPWAGTSAVQPPGENDLGNLRREADIARDAGLGGKAFWITETALQSLDTCVWSVDEQSQAQMMTDLFDDFARSTTPRIKAVAWFTIQDDERDQRRSLEINRQPGVCYAIYGLGLIDSKGRRRPVFDRYRQIIALSKVNTSFTR